MSQFVTGCDIKSQQVTSYDDTRAYLGARVKGAQTN